ncbi:MAG: FAD-binding oxidoreductase [Candidatus Saccharibacteria bacterium]|nr:FAD-binding oxidoreductase [Pseudorhodobacter sp.]
MSADPATLWHATAAPGARYPAAQGEIEADLLIVGGGFVGLSTALHAAEAGLRVVLVEAERIAWGATGRNAGFVVPNFAKIDPDAVVAKLGSAYGAALNRFAAESADLVFGLIRRHGIACDAQQSGWIQPAHSDEAFAGVQSRASQWQALNRPVQVLNAAEVTDMTGAEGYKGGWIDRSGGVLNPVAYARGLARAAAAAGAQLCEDSAVLHLAPMAGGWRATTAAAHITAPRVILATNAYAGSLAPGLDRSFFPLTVFQVATQPLDPDIRRRVLPGGQCVSDTRRNLFTFRFDAEQRLISGGMHIMGLGADTRVPKTVHRRLARLLNLPDLPPLAFSWSGLAAVMPDFLPSLTEIASGLIAGFACNGRGIAMSTRSGQDLSLWAQGKPLADLALPHRPMGTIPFHSLLRHAPQALLPISMVKDQLDNRRSQ